MRYAVPIALGVVTLACSAELPPIVDCEPMGDRQPFCLFQNPEDIVALPDREALIISQMGTMEGDRPGSIVLFEPESERVSLLFDGSASEEPSGPSSWGSERCPGPPGREFSPHGIDLAYRDGGELQLLAVNHGARETIEFFEVELSSEPPSLRWRGCVPVPEDEFLNDVAALSSGGFVTSHMYDKHGRRLLGIGLGAWQAMLGVDTGYLMEWQPGEGWAVVPNSHGPFPNGVAVSVDERFIFSNVYSAGEVRKIRRADGVIVQRVEVLRPDNSSWDETGSLLVVSHTAAMSEMSACMQEGLRSCPIEFTVLRLDPETLSASVVLTQAGAPMGAGTVATQMGKSLYIGSFSGDRILRVPYRFDEK